MGKTKIVPVTSDTLGTIKKGLDQSLQLFPCHQSAGDALHGLTIEGKHNNNMILNMNLPIRPF
jgi:hypothetical protein